MKNHPRTYAFAVCLILAGHTAHARYAGGQARLFVARGNSSAGSRKGAVDVPTR
jgi:hypothetical protein